ncbi:MAG TPA: choice-of-anchor Q domain-containing protein, partial [Solirubrobacterales bacterium]
MSRLVRLLGLLAVVVACLPAEVASAAALSYPVTTTADSGAGSLRTSIEAANAHTGVDSIPIEVAGTIELEGALPAVADDLAISGPGASSLTIERNADTEFRIFDFGDGLTASLNGVTVSGGADPQGGGIRNGNGSLTLTRVVVAGNEATAEEGTQLVAEGGGVLSEGPLTVRESAIRDNKALAKGGTTSGFALGAGIMARGALTVQRSTISGNAAVALGEGGKQTGALGGGLRVIGAPAIVELSTISGNSVLADKSLTTEARGGGLQGDELTLTSSTVTGNSLFSNGFAAGANIEFGGTTLIRNTIVADPLGAADSCGNGLPPGAGFSSGGFNLDEDGSCGFEGATDLSAVVAGVDPVLRDNGGPTPTHALLAGSAALDRGSAFGSTIDQRGLPRPSDFASISNSEGGDGSDIGAFELQVPPPAAGGGPVLVTAAPADRTP